MNLIYIDETHKKEYSKIVDNYLIDESEKN